MVPNKLEWLQSFTKFHHFYHLYGQEYQAFYCNNHHLKRYGQYLPMCSVIFHNLVTRVHLNAHAHIVALRDG